MSFQTKRLKSSPIFVLAPVSCTARARNNCDMKVFSYVDSYNNIVASCRFCHEEGFLQIVEVVTSLVCVVTTILKKITLMLQWSTC